MLLFVGFIIFCDLVLKLFMIEVKNTINCVKYTLKYGIIRRKKYTKLIKKEGKSMKKILFSPIGGTDPISNLEIERCCIFVEYISQI